MIFKIPKSFLLNCLTEVTLSLSSKKLLQHNPKVKEDVNQCYEYIFNDYFMSIIHDTSGIIRCTIADIELYGSNHNVCIVKNGASPVELKFYCCESDDDLDFTLFNEPKFFEQFRKFYEELVDNFLSTTDKSTLIIPQM
jgi:hypothetical protein